MIRLERSAKNKPKIVLDADLSAFGFAGHTQGLHGFAHGVDPHHLDVDVDLG
jgi:hypothetical protein